LVSRCACPTQAQRPTQICCQPIETPAVFAPALLGCARRWRTHLNFETVFATGRHQQQEAQGNPQALSPGVSPNHARSQTTEHVFVWCNDACMSSRVKRCTRGCTRIDLGMTCIEWRPALFWRAQNLPFPIRIHLRRHI
jgi:hypothetical protein